MNKQEIINELLSYKNHIFRGENNKDYGKVSSNLYRKYKDINEFTFRLNQGNCQIDTQDRLDSLFSNINMLGRTVTYKELTR